MSQGEYPFPSQGFHLYHIKSSKEFALLSAQNAHLAYGMIIANFLSKMHPNPPDSHPNKRLEY